MPVYRPDAEGVTTRGPLDPCDHRFVVSYADAYGTYTRCKVCRAEWKPQAPQIDAQRAIRLKPTRYHQPERLIMTTITHAEVRDDGVIDLRDDNDMLVGLIRLSAVESITVDWNVDNGRATIRTASGAEHVVNFNDNDGGEAAIALMTDLTRSTVTS